MARRSATGAEEPGKFVVRRASGSDADALVRIDSVAAGGDEGRRTNIGRWCGQGLAIMAEDASGPLGYCVVEYTFFEQGFVTMLMVAPAVRGRGVGGRLLAEAVTSCVTPKLFTSTNVSNQLMQRLLLLRRAGWAPVHDQIGRPSLRYTGRPWSRASNAA
ncbi:GNAT family N-acetyltransferase [Streptomyces sp. NPDC059814]|uniref:GNAT family N-acetyltransferase n=1 Tax=Streptomyces sp. NPDC059814 TaxID=3346959 RepID=UPI0036604925